MSARFGRYTFHADRRQLFRDAVELHLTPKAFDLLALLIERAPAVVGKAEIHERLWARSFVSDSTLAGLVKELRRALEDDHKAALVRTAHRVGYAFAGDLETEGERGVPTTCCLTAGTRRIALHEGINVIGRDPDVTVWLDVAGVSRRHAQIVLENGVASLEDLGSKNGTFVRDEPVRGRVTLGDGDRIQLATELLVFHTSGRGVSTITGPTASAHTKEE